jgi:hypothetical protein
MYGTSKINYIERQMPHVLSYMENLVLTQCKADNVWGWVTAGGVRVKGGEYGGSTLYMCMKIE